jgi:hypothetical protein
LDADAAKEVYGTAEKSALKSRPFMTFFQYGKGKSGYWRYDHMVSQLEDCVDCLKVLFPHPSEPDKTLYRFAFEFDHSAGHSKNRPDGVSVATDHMNVSYGGKQAHMRPSDIPQVPGYLGSCPERSLHPGSSAIHDFVEEDSAPVDRPNAPKLDTQKPGAVQVTRDRSADDLRQEFRRTGRYDYAQGTAETVKQRARAQGLSMTKTFFPSIEGYVGKPKGLKQIAFERGFYTREQLLKTRGPDAIKAEELRKTIGECLDFQQELSQLQFIAQELGVEVRMTPKAHAELAGRGTEYSWGYSKLKFRASNTGTDEERSQNLEENVRKALAELTVPCVRNF